MQKWLSASLLIIILLFAAALRLTGIDWDEYHHFHPDERYITWVATSIEWPSDWRSAFSPHQSSINPYYWPADAESEGIVVPQGKQRKFAYGHFPLYLGVAATRIVDRIGFVLAPVFANDWLFTQDILNKAGWIEYRHLTAVTRTLTALFDVGVVYLVYFLGKRLFDIAVGLLAAAFLAVNVMHIQLSHFFAFDPYMTFFVVLAITLMVLSVQAAVPTDSGDLSKKGVVYFLLAAGSIGFAVGSKFSAILLFLPLMVTLWLVKSKRWLALGGTAVILSFVIFFLTNPFALLDFSCELLTPVLQIGPLRLPAIDLRSCFLENITTQSAMVRGRADLPFTHQYIGTIPYLYYIEMQLRWGMGPLLGLLAFWGFGWVTWSGVRYFPYLAARRPTDDLQNSECGEQSTLNNQQLTINNTVASLLILLAWCVPFFLVTGNFHVKFMRYLQPITPFLMIFAAVILLNLPWPRMRWVVGTAVLLFTSLFALSFVNIFSVPHPWVAASYWVYANVPPGTLILSEQWDDALPVSMDFDGKFRLRSEYENEELTWLTKAGDGDDTVKLDENLQRLARADYVTILSNRVYGVVPRLPNKFPISSQYHQLLFDESLGYEPVFIVNRLPHLFGVYLYADTMSDPDLIMPASVTDYLAGFSLLNWGRADESFTVYDQPMTIIFKNNGRLSPSEMRQQFTP